ncbi:glycosyltransferase [Virgibacillus ihumii]|uniref:glycosyltransferase n=1 Tax=Virgibacillus ihumii TaxID=2686091 RepID=UPI00157BBCF0|nr:glycosyltransferase [Virgibacillus ihumii]
MKVLQINSVCGVGSTGRIATDIHNILVSEGHESYIAYGRGEAKNCDNAIKIGTDIDNYAHVGLTRVFDRHGFGSKKATADFIQKVEKLNPDIIHLHNIHGYYINIEILFDYLKKSNKPVIWTLHDCWAFTGHCTHFDFAGCDKWKTGCFSCPEKNSYPKSNILDNSKLNYKQKKKIFTGLENMTIVTPSNWLAGLVKESFLSEYHIKVINNGVDLDTFKPVKNDFRKQYNLEDKYIVLGVAGVWNERKGYYYFLELSKELKSDEVIVLVGITQKQKEKLPSNIVGITHTNNVNELAEIYTTSDVFVNLTLEDTFPTTNLEAIACGTPVITFNTGGSVESIDVNTGIIVEKANLENLHNSIRIIKRNYVRDYYQSCINKAASMFNKIDKFYDYVNLYERI